MSNKHLINLPFNEARKYVQDIGLSSTGEWKKWSKGKLKGKTKRPNFIPSNPDVVYKSKGWKSWSNWIGTERNIDYLTFNEARTYVRNLRLKNFEEWKNYYQKKIEGLEKPENIPWNPQSVYKDEWQGARDWIGTDWMDFEEAREFIRSLNLSGQNEWKLYSKGELEGYELKPQNIPSDPKRVYPDKWIDLGDWLGTERKRTGITQNVDDTWLSYSDAKIFIHSLGLSGYNQWKIYISNSITNLPKKPRDIPKAPDFVYKNDGWAGWDDWLGHQIINNIIIEKETRENQEIILNESLKEEFLALKKEYKGVVNLLDSLFSLNKNISLIELKLDNETIDNIQDILFSFNQNFHELNQAKKAFIGLLFLLLIVYKSKKEISYSSVWQTIINHFKNYGSLTETFINNFFRGDKYPKTQLVESIEYACKVFHLRDNFGGRDNEQHYIRNTILLQIGLVDKSLNNLKLWLSNYNLPVVVSELLDTEEENYSKEFSEGWRALRRYRDNIISDIKLKSLLEQNIWFAHLTLDNLLTLSKQRVTDNSMLIEDEEELPIFYLSKIKYDNSGLKFILDAQDLYTLNLSGFRYELYIDDEYVGLLIADNRKQLVLEKTIEIINPIHNQVEIQIKNEDSDVVFSENIMLFDFNEQIIIFDEDGNIYQNIFKKLNVTKKYHILMDSDLDCNYNEESQREYFDGYATLVTDIKKSDNCEISYDGESLFELNFTKYIEKPQWIDQLVLYSKNDNSFTMDNEEEFILQVFNIEENEPLEDLPSDTKIIKWNYSGGYLDSNEIQNGRAKLNLYPEMITNNKHTLLIKYKGKAFKKVIWCSFFEKYAIPRLFKIDIEARSHEITSKNNLLNAKDIESNKFYLSDFKRRDVLFLKNKSKSYHTIKPNRIFKLKEFDGFGENVFISEHLFNSDLNKLFNYIDIEKYIHLNQKSLSKLFIKKELPSDVIFTILDKKMCWHKFTYSEIQSTLENNFLKLDYEIAIGLIIFKEEILDGFYEVDFLDSFSDLKNHEILKILLLSNYPFLLKKKYLAFIRDYILSDMIGFFKDFYSHTITTSGILVKLEFSKYAILFEHICMGFTFGKENASLILEDAILDKKANSLIETPIILFKLLEESKSPFFMKYFDNLLSDVELKDERDITFVDRVVSNLFDSTTIKGIEKHNLKVAMHHINGKYYLREALRRI